MCASWVSCQLNLNVYKPLSMQFVSPFPNLTLLKAQQRQLFPSLQPMPPSSCLLLCILFCRGLVGLVASHRNSPAPTLGSAVSNLPETSCPYQHLQEWSTVEASHCVVVLPTPAFQLPHGDFSQELLSCCF